MITRDHEPRPAEAVKTRDRKGALSEVAHALMRAVSTLVSTPFDSNGAPSIHHQRNHV
jgi:hypothetical protein